MQELLEKIFEKAKKSPLDLGGGIFLITGEDLSDEQKLWADEDESKNEKFHDEEFYFWHHGTECVDMDDVREYLLSQCNGDEEETLEEYSYLV